ncbi:DUF2913 family protein [Vibrio lentus]
MSNTYQYYKALNTLVSNALLHLFMQTQATKGFVPKAKRNAILVKYIKARQHLPEFKAIKKDMKTMLNLGRKGGDLQQGLDEINTMAQEHYKRLSHADDLYVALNHAYEQAGFESRLEHVDEHKEEDILYMAAKEIEEGFDDKNIQLRPLKLFIKTDKLSQLIKIFDNEGHYTLVQDSIDEQGFSHLLLTHS